MCHKFVESNFKWVCNEAPNGTHSFLTVNILQSSSALCMTFFTIQFFEHDTTNTCSSFHHYSIIGCTICLQFTNLLPNCDKYFVGNKLPHHNVIRNNHHKIVPSKFLLIIFKKLVFKILSIVL